jgi:hypothetical protein
MTNEKQIEDFNYLITTDGQVISIYYNKPICQWIDNTGYLQVKIKKDGKWYYRRVHRLVAEAFIPNPDNLPQVNHKNGDKTDCSMFNLEWCTNKDNTQHGYDNELYHSKHRCIVIEVYDKQGNYIHTYKSIRETAEQLHINRKTLSRILFDNKENNYDYNFKAIC